MHLFQKMENAVISVIRMDLQLHFFWSFVLTIMAVFYEPFIISGLAVTVLKEGFDVMAQKGWSWGDVIWGIAGFFAGIIFLYYTGYF